MFVAPNSGPARPGESAVQKDLRELQEQIMLLLTSEEWEEEGRRNFMFARAFLMRKFPFTGRALSAVTPVQAKGLLALGGMACDKNWRVYYDPECWLKYTKIECAAMLAHEVYGHLLGRHFQRAQAHLGYMPEAGEPLPPHLKKQAEKINRAQDLAIHGLESWIRDNIPKDSLFPEKYGLPLGKAWEWYYANLPDDEEGGSGKDPGEDPGKNLGGQPGAPSKGGPGKERCCGGGSGAGNPRPWELPEPGKGQGKHDVPGLNEQQGEQVRQGTAQDIKEAQKGGRLRGSGYGGWIAWADKQLAPAQTPWQTLAATVIRQQRIKIGADDYSWQRPSPLSWSLDGIILPSLVSFEWTASVVLDQSGSMTDDDVVESLSEVEGLVRQCGAKCNVYVATDGVNEAHRDLSSMRTLLGKRHGGGTDLRPAIEAAAKDDCDLLVVCTDGYTPWPDKAPTVPVVVLLFGNNCGKGRVPSWATTLICD